MYNTVTFFDRRYMKMAAQFTYTTSYSNHCTTFAAACSSARISLIMDTVSILAVSVFVCLISLVLVSPGIA